MVTQEGWGASYSRDPTFKILWGVPSGHSTEEPRHLKFLPNW